MRYTYEEALARQAELYAARDTAADALRAATGERGPLGLTPDAVKGTPEWRAAKAAYDAAHDALRTFNASFVRTFRAEERARRGR